jgi:hypothetical protein
VVTRDGLGRDEERSRAWRKDAGHNEAPEGTSSPVPLPPVQAPAFASGSACASTCGSVDQFVRPFGQDEEYRLARMTHNGVIHEFDAAAAELPTGVHRLSPTRHPV